MFFDPMYLLFAAPGLLLAAYAQFRVKTAFAEGKKINAACGLTGAQTAKRILSYYGLEDVVSVEGVKGFLGDHYDPRSKTLRLSPDVFSGRSLSALGVAAHEVGHAIQHAKRYAPLTLRNAIVPVASFGSNLSYFIIFLGLIMSSGGLIMAGVVLFSGVVLFQVINLPVEFDASSRAKQILTEHGLISTEEREVVSSVLSAAALTYVAATVSAILTMIYYLMLARNR